MLSVIWFIFFILFLYLTLDHFNEAQNNISHMKKIKGIAKVNGISTGIVETEKFIKQFITHYNNHNKKNNMIAGSSMLIAALTSLISFFLSLGLLN